MKKSLIALLALAGMASANVIDQGNGSVTVDGTRYAYLYNGSEWKYLPRGTTSGDLHGPTENYYPTGSEDVLMGFDYDAATGIFTTAQTLTKINCGSMQYHESTWLGNVELTGGNVTNRDFHTMHLATNAQVIISAAIGWKANNTVINYGDLTHSTAVIKQTGGAIWDMNNLTLNASYSMSGMDTLLNRVLMSGVSFQYNAPTFLGNISVTDLRGDAMEYIGVISGLDALNEGQCALLVVNNNISLVAKSVAVPEPATATLSLLALAGLAARRRRR